MINNYVTFTEKKNVNFQKFALNCKKSNQVNFFEETKSEREI
jgi:hypothetical protein